MKYYMVVCQRGHCGKYRSVDIKFAEKARNLLEAMDIAKNRPAVKHTKPILRAWEITEQEYLDFRKTSAYERLENFSKTT